MNVISVSTYSALDKLRNAWEAAYAADPLAHVFVSWPWIRSWLQVSPYAWLILVARPSDSAPPVAFCALNMSGLRGRRRVEGDLRLGVGPWADYSGFVCVPGHEQEAIPAFANWIARRLAWRRFCLSDVMDPRIDAFSRRLGQAGFTIASAGQTPCPWLELPETWEQYLDKFLSTHARKSLRQQVRRLEQLDDFRVTDIREDDPETEVDALLHLWQQRWGEKSTTDLAIIRGALLGCHERHGLWLGGMWEGSKPIASLAGYLDPARKTFSYFISGFDASYDRLSPGRVIVALSIRSAIERGLRAYDFLRGGEAYKYSFGATDRHAESFVVSPGRLRAIPARVSETVRSLFTRRQVGVSSSDHSG